jgi:hypothetical protein
MPRKGHSEEQIVAALLQAEAVEKVTDICPNLSISQATEWCCCPPSVNPEGQAQIHPLINELEIGDQLVRNCSQIGCGSVLECGTRTVRFHVLASLACMGGKLRLVRQLH